MLGPLLVPIPRLAHHKVPHPPDAVGELVVEGPLYANLNDKHRGWALENSFDIVGMLADIRPLCQPAGSYPDSLPIKHDL